MPSSEEECRAVFPTASTADIEVVREVCNAVSNRAAKLAAAGQLYVFNYVFNFIFTNHNYYPNSLNPC